MTMLDAYTNKGNSLFQLSDSNQVMLIFLRHFGCNFCRETLRNIANSKSEIESNGYKIILVHQSSKEYARKMLDIYELSDLEHISDRSLILYKSFGISSLKFVEYFNFKVLFRFFSSVLKGDLPGKIQGDPNQKPGIILFHERAIIDRFNYRHIAQRPNLSQIATQII